MSLARTAVVVLGAGPAGLGTALRLGRRDEYDVAVLERANVVGGNAGSFALDGQRVDYGSHRLHPTCAPEILDDIRTMLGGDLLDQRRHGRIRLQGRWVHFPLQPLDLLLHVPPAFALGIVRDLLPAAGRASVSADTFAGVLERRLGTTICQEFYFPYARKIWGLSPDEIDAEQARRRVSAASIAKMVRKVLRAVPGVGPRGGGRFYYPRLGFGQISEGYLEGAIAHGAKVELGSTVTAIECRPGGGATVSFEDAGGVRRVAADRVISTIPLTVLVRAIRPAAPDDVLAAADSLRYRAMLLIYLVLETDRFSEYDAHYFPGADVAITRLSEPKNYSRHGPEGSTVLCAELPCSQDDAHWRMSDEDLRDLVLAALARAGAPVVSAVRRVVSRRLTHAYPIYDRAFHAHLDSLDGWVRGLDGILTVGRQGLFAHDNTHHTLAMAYAAVDCLRSDGSLDADRWAAARRSFEQHVVED